METQAAIKDGFIARIKQHQGILHKVCFVYARNSADKEDLYQEIVLQLWKSYSSFKGDAEFSTWMYRVALNTAITFNKKKFRFIRNREETAASYNLEQAADYSEDIAVLYKAISQLKEVEKAIILLWLEERSYEEIAETVGMTVKNVSVKLVRIKSRLAALIEKLQ